MELTKQLKQRREAAKKERDHFQPMMDEAYQYAIPYRRGIKDSGAGEKRVDQVFDSTAINSAVRFAGKYQQDIWPPGEQNFTLAPGPMVIDKRQKEQLQEQLAPITAICQAFFENGDWDTALHEMGLDLSAGNGAMLMNSTADPYTLWSPVSVPIDELLLEAGPDNSIWGRFWTRKMTVRVMFQSWPDGKFGTDLTTLRDSSPESQIEVHTDCYWEPRDGNDAPGRWRLVIWCDKQDATIVEKESRSSPWLTPRYIRVPGETYGRGVVMLAMPEIKTLNTAKRLQLQAAAIAMLGIYTAVDDGVFNPDLSELAPGAFWKVSRNGGTMGPTVNRFPDPRLDLSGLVVQEMQMNVKEILLDNALPSDMSAVKSPTEILERVKRLAVDHMGAFGRQVREVVTPAVMRVIELAYEKGLLKDAIPIDQLFVKVQVQSPLAQAREAARVQKILQWLEIVLSITAAVGTPQAANYVAKVEDALLRIGRALNVPEDLIVPAGERDAMKKRDQEQQIALAMASAGVAAAQGGGAPA